MTAVEVGESNESFVDRSLSVVSLRTRSGETDIRPVVEKPSNVDHQYIMSTLCLLNASA